MIFNDFDMLILKIKTNLNNYFKSFYIKNIFEKYIALQDQTHTN